jgi:hypothetical protein
MGYGWLFLAGRGVRRNAASRLSARPFAPGDDKPAITINSWFPRLRRLVLPRRRSRKMGWQALKPLSSGRVGNRAKNFLINANPLP